MEDDDDDDDDDDEEEEGEDVEIDEDEDDLEDELEALKSEDILPPGSRRANAKPVDYSSNEALEAAGLKADEKDEDEDEDDFKDTSMESH